MYKRGSSSTEHNINKINDAMASPKKNSTKEIVRKTEVLKSKVAEGSWTNGSNLMDMATEEEEEEVGNECLTSVLMTMY